MLVQHMGSIKPTNSSSKLSSNYIKTSTGACMIIRYFKKTIVQYVTEFIFKLYEHAQQNLSSSFISMHIQLPCHRETAAYLELSIYIYIHHLKREHICETSRFNFNNTRRQLTRLILICSDLQQNSSIYLQLSIYSCITLILNTCHTGRSNFSNPQRYVYVILLIATAESDQKTHATKIDRNQAHRPS